MISLRINEIEISCKNKGEGAPLLFLHGFGGQPSDWRSIEKEFVKSHRVLTPNLSRVYLSTETFSEQVDVVIQLIKELAGQYGKMTVVGASFGGALAWALRHKASEFVEKVVLINPMPPHPLRRMQSQALRDLVSLSRYPFFLSIYLRSPFGKRTITTLANSVRVDWAGKFRRFNILLSRKQKWVSLLLARFSKLLIEEDWESWERGFVGSGPKTLLILGELDQLFGTQHSEWMQSGLGNCEVVLLKGGAHMAIRTNPDDVNGFIKSFLKNQSCQKAS